VAKTKDCSILRTLPISEYWREFGTMTTTAATTTMTTAAVAATTTTNLDKIIKQIKKEIIRK
jgi:hypothetical protein